LFRHTDHKQLQLTDELKPKVFFVSGHNDNVLSIEVHASTRMHELVDADFIHWYRRSDGDMPPLQYVHVYGNNQQVNEVDCLFKNMEGLSAWGDQQPVAWLAQPFLRDMKVQKMNEVERSLTQVDEDLRDLSLVNIIPPFMHNHQYANSLHMWMLLLHIEYLNMED